MTEPRDDRDADDEQLRRYLLGELSEDEAAAIESAYFADPSLLARLELAEQDLLDEYAGDMMAPADRETLERTILATPEGRSELALARALRSARRDEAVVHGADRAAGRIDRRWLAAAAIVGLTAGGLATVWLLRGDPDRPIQATTTPSAQPPAALPDPPSPVIVTLALTRDLARSEGRPPTLVIVPATTHIDLTLTESIPTESVRARVETVEGKEVWTGTFDRAADGRARVRVPAAVLGVGDYVLVIGEGAAASGAPAYYFRARLAAGPSEN